LDKKRKVSDFALEFLRGMNDVGILGCLKHFPGHGNTNVDSHLGLFKETRRISSQWFLFIKGIENNDSIMIGHLAVPALREKTLRQLCQNLLLKRFKSN
jgi:beta-glucosidase-like glycosyl hydrolase